MASCVTVESICLSINGIYVGNVGGGRPVRRAWPGCAHDLFYLYNALWHVAIALAASFDQPIDQAKLLR